MQADNNGDAFFMEDFNKIIRRLQPFDRFLVQRILIDGATAAVFIQPQLRNLLFEPKRNLVIGMGFLTQMDDDEIRAVLYHEFTEVIKRIERIGKLEYEKQPLLSICKVRITAYAPTGIISTPFEFEVEADNSYRIDMDYKVYLKNGIYDVFGTHIFSKSTKDKLK